MTSRIYIIMQLGSEYDYAFIFRLLKYFFGEKFH